MQIKGRPAPRLQLCWAHLGQHAEVSEILERVVVARRGIGSTEDEVPESFDIMLLEAAELVGHREAAGLLLRRLADSSLRTTGHFFMTCIGRHLGAAATLR